MNKLNKTKAIELIEEKIKQFEIVRNNAKYTAYEDNRYNDSYEVAYHGTERLLDSLFGKDTWKEFRTNVNGISFSVLGGEINYISELDDYKKHISRCISQLKVYKEQIVNFWPDEEFFKKDNNKTPNIIFIVHGHNEEIKQSIARIIEKQDIDSIILHEKPNKGKTIIEKIESYSNVGAAIIIFSGDDYGYAKNQNNTEAKLRPRQNVIFEMGLFIGKIGRDKVICLFEENVDIEILSDYKGIIYIPYDSKGKWKYDIGKELREIGFNFDLNSI